MNFTAQKISAVHLTKFLTLVHVRDFFQSVFVGGGGGELEDIFSKALNVFGGEAYSKEQGAESI